jgi:GxxExxY protein
VPVPVTYKGTLIDCGYRLDFIVGERVVVELKAVERLLPIHAAQVVTYLKLLGLQAGLLVNFNVRVLRDGLRRLWPGSRSFSSSPLLFDPSPSHDPPR